MAETNKDTVKKDGPANREAQVEGTRKQVDKEGDTKGLQTGTDPSGPERGHTDGLQTEEPAIQGDDTDADEDYRLFPATYEGHVGGRVQLSFVHNLKEDVKGQLNADDIKDFDKKNLKPGDHQNLRIKHSALTQMLIDADK